MKWCVADLHIHSTLSPCGSLDMSPGRIVKEAKERGIHLIALTDHNTCDNVVYAQRVGEKMGVKVIPGMELQTEEEVHLLAYFESLDAACSFKDRIYPYLPDVKNDPEYFGDQVIVDESEAVVGFEEKLLINSLLLSVDECVEMVREHEGLPVPAHVDRDAYGLISQLGFIPDYLGFEALEVSKHVELEEAVRRWPELSDYAVISSSDAHYPEDIGSAVTLFLMEELSWEDLLGALKERRVRVLRHSSYFLEMGEDAP